MGFCDFFVAIDGKKWLKSFETGTQREAMKFVSFVYDY